MYDLDTVPMEIRFRKSFEDENFENFSSKLKPLRSSFRWYSIDRSGLVNFALLRHISCILSKFQLQKNRVGLCIFFSFRN